MTTTTLESNPINVAKARERIRIAQHRLAGIAKAHDFVTRISMAVPDRIRIVELLDQIRDEATEEHKEAVKLEVALMNKRATTAA